MYGQGLVQIQMQYFSSLHGADSQIAHSLLAVGGEDLWCMVLGWGRGASGGRCDKVEMASSLRTCSLILLGAALRSKTWLCAHKDHRRQSPDIRQVVRVLFIIWPFCMWAL
jgi:hypothetical protein